MKQGQVRAYVDHGMHEIEKISNHRVEKRSGVWRATFRCHWKNYPLRNGTWEPLENLLSCYNLVKKYYFCAAQRHKAKCGKLNVERIGRIPPPPSYNTCLRGVGADTDLWYRPKGDELVMKILGGITVRTQKYLAVKFKHLEAGEVVYVPLCLMEYYFPVETMLLHTKKVVEAS